MSDKIIRKIICRTCKKDITDKEKYYSNHDECTCEDCHNYFEWKHEKDEEEKEEEYWENYPYG